MKAHVIPQELQRKIDASVAAHRKKIADPVAKLVPYVLADAVVDADRLQIHLLVGVEDAAGQPVLSNVFIDYRVIDENGTGSTFVLDGNPIGSSFGRSIDGFAIAVDPLLTGKKPGIFVVRATAPGNADPTKVFADFRLTISSQIPTEIRIVERGTASVPVGDLLRPDAKVELLDQDGEPITHGSIQLQIDDPNGTGSLFIILGHVATLHQQGLTPEGTVLGGEILVGASAPGKDFYLLVNRIGRDPTLRIPYTAVAQ